MCFVFFFLKLKLCRMLRRNEAVRGGGTDTWLGNDVKNLGDVSHPFVTSQRANVKTIKWHMSKDTCIPEKTAECIIWQNTESLNQLVTTRIRTESWTRHLIWAAQSELQGQTCYINIFGRAAWPSIGPDGDGAFSVPGPGWRTFTAPRQHKPTANVLLQIDNKRV